MKHIAYASVQPKNLLDISLQVARNRGAASIIGKDKISSVLTLNKTIVDNLDSLKNFKKDIDIQLRISESLALAYLAMYYQNNAPSDTEYLVYVDIEDSFAPQSELYLSDGVLAAHDRRKRSTAVFSPFQQVMAQNLKGSNQGKDIQEIVIEEINRKIAKRSNYNDVSGLLVSVFTRDGGHLDIGRIISECDVEKFLPTFLLVYYNDLGSCYVFHLDKALATNGEELERVSRQSLIIHGIEPKS